jgi:uncharacterized protein YaiL (DUF2058 family)
LQCCCAQLVACIEPKDDNCRYRPFTPWAHAMASLQDQLLQAGIVDKKKAKQIKQEQRKEAKVRQKGQVEVNEDKEQARRAQLEKAERDRQLNKQQVDKAEQRAIQAQVIQLIKMNRIDRGKGDIAYQFTDGSKIKKIYVTAQLQGDLVKGRLAIARLEGAYELLPAVAAEKIMQRDQQVIVMLNKGATVEVDEDDPYADYQIPDDLMW